MLVGMHRRFFLMGAAAQAARAQYAPRRKYRAVIIGDTGHGNYGHGWDLAWSSIPEVEVAAVADPNDAGRAKAQERCRAKKAYRDYREMIAREKPDIVTICPRWCDQRLDMVKAATDAGAHILVEKPIARTLVEADQIVAMAEARGVKVQVGHTARVMAVTALVRNMVEAGELGTLLEIRGRGKEDKRAGGEDLIVLGTHVFDLMRHYAGDPQWVFAHATESGREVTRSMMREASEPVGQVGGDQIAAMFLFGNGVHGYFGSKGSEVSTGRRFGLTLAGSRGWVFVPLNDVPGAPPYVMRSPAWVPEKGESWERVNYPADRAVPSRGGTNHLMAIDLIEAIEKDRPPACSARDGRWTIEMVAGIYQSQMNVAKVDFPLRTRP